MSDLMSETNETLYVIMTGIHLLMQANGDNVTPITLHDK